MAILSKSERDALRTGGHDHVFVHNVETVLRDLLDTCEALEVALAEVVEARTRLLEARPDHRDCQSETGRTGAGG